MKSRYLLPIAFMAFALILVSCGEHIKGNGNVTEVSHDLNAFDEIDISGMFEVELVKGKPKLDVVTDENLHEHISYEVRDGELKIHTNDKILDAEELRLIIFYDELDELEVNGACEVRSSDVLKGDHFEIDVSGACDLVMDVRLNDLILDLSGGSDMTLSGKADNVSIDISGAAEIKAAELIADVVEIDITGAGEVEIEANKELDVEITGAGEVKYLGDPELSQSITGAGEVKRLNK